MYSIFKSKQADVITHWYALVPGFTTSTKEFYEAVEKELKDRQVPGLEISRVDFAEGGLLSQKREYLRMTRERLVFDICAAPFGTGYFFSCRFAEIPATVKLWELCAVLLASLVILSLNRKVELASRRLRTSGTQVLPWAGSREGSRLAGGLERAWDGSQGEEMLAVEFGLKEEFMLPLAGGRLDPFIGIVGALAELGPGELGLFQVLFQPVEHPWAESMMDSVTHADGKPFFINSPELAGAAKAKASRPLHAAVVRILVRASAFDRVLQLARDLAGSLRVFAHPEGNELIPLRNDDYPFEEHIEDVLRRQTRRTLLPNEPHSQWLERRLRLHYRVAECKIQSANSLSLFVRSYLLHQDIDIQQSCLARPSRTS